MRRGAAKMTSPDYPLFVADGCLRDYGNAKVKARVSDIQGCMRGTRKAELLLSNDIATKAANPLWVPWVTVDGRPLVSTSRGRRLSYWRPHGCASTGASLHADAAAAKGVRIGTGCALKIFCGGALAAPTPTPTYSAEVHQRAAGNCCATGVTGAIPSGAADPPKRERRRRSQGLFTDVFAGKARLPSLRREDVSRT